MGPDDPAQVTLGKGARWGGVGMAILLAWQVRASVEDAAAHDMHACGPCHAMAVCVCVCVDVSWHCPLHMRMHRPHLISPEGAVPWPATHRRRGVQRGKHMRVVPAAPHACRQAAIQVLQRALLEHALAHLYLHAVTWAWHTQWEEERAAHVELVSTVCVKSHDHHHASQHST